jgi:D-threo-aldose 1-dehydrogenase
MCPSSSTTVATLVNVRVDFSRNAIAAGRIGATTVQITELVFGSGPIGGYAADGDEASGLAAVATAVDRGLTRFDTAPSYGGGAAEAVLGAALAGADDGQLTLAQLRVATKVGRLATANPNPYARPRDPGDSAGVGSFDFTARGVRESLSASLSRLRLSRVEAVYLHDPDFAPALVRDEALPELRRLRAEGRFAQLGVATTDPATARGFVEERLVDCVMIAAAYSLTQRRAESLLDRCAELGVDVVVAAPFDSGLLATPRPRPEAPWQYRRAPRDAVELAERLARICERHGATLPQAALQFPARHRAVTGVAVGMRDATEVAADVDAATVELPEALWPELDRALSR